MLSLPAIGLMLGAGVLGAEVPDIYLPYLQDNPPEIVEELPETRIGDVIVREFWFVPRDIPGTDERHEVHSVLARPATPGPHPAILFCHGGGGFTQRERVSIIGWAERGYVCIGQDQPGFASREGLSRGPYFEGRGTSFVVTPDATASPLYDGVIAVLRSLSILRTHPEVDPERIGVFGGSWGGYMTNMAAALAGDKLAAAFATYGAGYYDVATDWALRLQNMPDDERERWIAAFDPGRLAGNTRADYMILQATNDWYFWPPSVEMTLDNIPAEGPGPRKNWLFSPNDYHAIRLPGGTSDPHVNHAKHRTYMEVRFMDWRLKGEGAAFPTAEVSGEPTREGDCIRVRFSTTSELPISSAEVYWSGGEMPWRMQWWEAVQAEAIGNGVYEARIPVRHTDLQLNWVGVVSDEGAASVSTRIQRMQPTELGFEAGSHPVPVALEDLQPLVADERWRWTAGTVRGGEGFGSAQEAEAARGDGVGRRITGQYSVAVWGLRAADIKAAGATGIRLWVRSAKPEPVETLHIGLTVEVAPGTRYIFNAQSVEGLAIGPQWQCLELPWEAFWCADAPVELLSDGLGELRVTISSRDGATVYFDDVEFM